LNAQKTIIVPDDFQSIQEAIDAADAYDIILVRSGVYNESLTIDKPLTLCGENREETIINRTYPAIPSTIMTIDASGVIIKNFTMFGLAWRDLGGGSRVSVRSDLYISNLENTAIVDNIIIGVEMIITSCKDIMIFNNTIRQSRLYTSKCVGCKILQNNFDSSTLEISSWRNIIQRNKIKGGIYLIGNQNVIECNNITHGGIDILSSSNILRNNIISNCNIGICMLKPRFDRYYEVSNNLIIENTLVNNSIGISAGGERNKIYHNNFINNTIQAEDQVGLNRWDNGYPSGGNYWSDYNGTDEFSGEKQNEPGSDGIGDVPYKIPMIEWPNHYIGDTYPLMKPYGREKTKGLIDSDYLAEPYKLANFSLIEKWVKKNCIPLLLLNSRGLGADEKLQDPNHRPTWYYRIVVDEKNRRFCVQLIAHWNEQVQFQCALEGHRWDYEPIFLYYHYYGKDIFESLKNEQVAYRYCFYSSEHWWTDWLSLSGVEGSDCDDTEDQKLFFWEDDEGNKHPVFTIGLTSELLIAGILQWKVPILDGCPMVSRFVGHAYSRVRRYGITGPELLENITADYFIENAEKFGYDILWPQDFNDDFYKDYVKPLTDEVIREWESREENPFKMTPSFKSGGKKSMDLISPWNEFYRGVFCVGSCFDPGCGYKGMEVNCKISNIQQEEWSEKINYQISNCSEVNFILDWNGEGNLDLHLWINNTKVCGKNYETGEVEIKDYHIDNTRISVEYSGPDEKPERIRVIAYSMVKDGEIRTKIPNLRFSIRIYARESSDPQFLLVEFSRNKYSVIKRYLFEVEWEGKTYPLLIISNASISNLMFKQEEKSIEFVVEEDIGYEWFSNVSIPQALLRDNATHPWGVFMNGERIEYEVKYNETYSFICFSSVSKGKVTIIIRGAEVIPEFQASTLLLLVALLISIILRYRN